MSNKHSQLSLKLLTFANKFFPKEENKTPEFHYDLLDLVAKGDDKQLVCCFRGSAKALCLDEVVKTPNGDKTIRDINVNDSIFGSDGNVHKVTGKSEVFNKPMYRLTFGDGRTIDASEDHLWNIYKRSHRNIGEKTKETTIRNKKYKIGSHQLYGFKEYTFTTKELLSDGVVYQRQVTDKNPKGIENKYYVPLCNEVKYPNKKVLVDPYTLGLLLGDGNIDIKTGFSRLHTHTDDLSHYRQNIPYDLSETKFKDENNARFSIKKISKLIKQIDCNKNCYNKHIPIEYIENSVDIRYSILRGLMDTDGTVCKKSGKASFCSVSKDLAYGVSDIVYSLGGTAYISNRDEAYIVALYTPANPFSLPRKAMYYKNNKRGYMPIVSIEQIDDKPSQCISTSAPDKLFLTTNYIVTHNSTIFTKWLPIYASFFGELEGIETDFIMIVSDTTSQAEDMIRELKDLYDCCSPDFKSLLREGSVWRSDEVSFINANGHVTNIVAKGAGQKVRGIKRRGKRPSYLIIDDLENDEAVLNEQNRKKLKEWFYRALLPCLSPTKSKIFFAGTPLHADSLLENLRNDERWSIAEFPIEDKEGKPLWGDRFSKKWIEEKKSEMKSQRMLTSFYQEYMLQIVSDEDQIFRPEYIKYVPKAELPDDLEYYITGDLAISEAKTADRTAFIVVGVSTANMIYLVDIVAERMPPSKQVKTLIDLCFAYYKPNTPVTLGVELVSYQKSFKTIFDKELEKMNIHARTKIPKIKELKPDAKKERRIQQLEPFFYRKSILMVKNKYSHILEEELLMFPRSKHDDISDAFAYVLQLIRWREGESEEVDYENDYEQYLLGGGAW